MNRLLWQASNGSLVLLAKAITMKNTKNQPLVSIIMPVYNAGRFLVPAIESILKQTYKNIEFIIVDDGSMDGSWETIKHYKSKYPKLIRVYQTEKKINAAGNGATNFGFQFAKGEFIARMDSDDVSLPTRIEKQVSFMQNHPGTIIVGTQAFVINGKGKTIGKKTMPTTNGEIYRQFSVFHPFIHPSVMIRRALLPNPNKIYAMRWDVNDDYYTFFSLLRHGFVANLAEPLIKYRIHGSNLSLDHPKQKFMNSVRIRLEAVKTLGYQMPAFGFLILAIQFIAVFLIPERLIVPLYMAIRGIRSPKTLKATVEKFADKHLRFPEKLFFVHERTLPKIGYTK